MAGKNLIALSPKAIAASSWGNRHALRHVMLKPSSVANNVTHNDSVLSSITNSRPKLISASVSNIQSRRKAFVSPRKIAIPNIVKQAIEVTPVAQVLFVSRDPSQV